MSEIRLRNAILTSIKRTWWLVGALLVVMSGFRLLFTIQFAHPEIWRDFLGSLPVAFAFGALHDLRILLLFALPPTFSLMWMRDRDRQRWKSWLRRTSTYWFLGTSVIVIALASEQIYYSYFGSRFNILAFGAIEDDIGAVLLSAWQTYPLLLYLLVGLILEYIVLRIIRRAFHFTDFLHASTQPEAEQVDLALNRHIVAHSMLAVVLCSLPLTPIFVSLDQEVPQTAFVRTIPENGVEKLAETLWTRISENSLSTARRYGFDLDAQAAIEQFTQGHSAANQGPLLQRLPVQAMTPTPHVERPPHVVLVVMESFATHLLQYQSPNFDLLGPAQPFFEQGALFERFLPTDNISIGSILGIILDLPYRPGTKHLSQSEQRHKSFATSSAKLFADQGYDTAFFYGGPANWRNLDQFLPLQGFQEEVGMEEILEQYHLDPQTDAGPWGLWDEHLFRAIADRLEHAEKPLFLVAFTTTNHPPHHLPASWSLPALRPPDRLLARTGPLDETQKAQLETYRYAAHQLGNWLQELQQTGLIQHCVIGVTGDHTAGIGIPFAHQEILLERAVPFLLWMPEAIRHQFQPNVLLPGSHKDIVPTLFHAAGLGPNRYRGLGSSLLDKNATHIGFNSSGLLLLEDGAIKIHEEGYDPMRWIGDSLELEPTHHPIGAAAALRYYQAALSLADWMVYEDSLPAKGN